MRAIESVDARVDGFVHPSCTGVRERQSKRQASGRSVDVEIAPLAVDKTTSAGGFLKTQGLDATQRTPARGGFEWLRLVFVGFTDKMRKWQRDIVHTKTARNDRLRMQRRDIDTIAIERSDTAKITGARLAFKKSRRQAQRCIRRQPARTIEQEIKQHPAVRLW
jgi:hypothetical protein